MSTVQAMVQKLQDKKQDFLEILEKVVTLESYVYGEREIKNRCGQYLEELFQGIGFETWQIDAGEAGIHICGKYGNGKNRIFLLGHYDTVFEIGTIKHRPFRIEDDYAFGPGIFDMKGGIVAFYMAMKVLLEDKLLPDDTQVTFFFSCDEEGGSITSRKEIEKMAKDADVCLVAEPGHKGEGYITYERYGRDVVTVKAIGVEGHAGHDPQFNPLIEISRQALYIQEKCRDEKKMFAAIVSMHGGFTNPTARTPEEAYLIADIRYRDAEHGKMAAELIQNLKSTMQGVRLEISGGVEKPALLQGSYSEKACTRTKEIIEEMGFAYLPTCLGGGSDGNFTSGIGCPTIDGLGLNGEFLHNPREYVVVSTIPYRVALIAELIRTL